MGRRAGLIKMPPARGWGVGIALHLALCVQVALAQPAAEAPPAAQDASKALSARIEALETLAKGALPQVALDSLLGVSLDDDSSMIERDGAARLEHRRLLIGLNQAERLQNKSEVELQSMRDQLLALELERKVLALPIEVRERLVEESERGSVPAAPMQPAPKVVPVVAAAKPRAVTQAPPSIADTQPNASVQHAAPMPAKRGWLSGWTLVIALWVVAFVVARVVSVVARPKNANGIPDERREQFAVWAQLGIYAASLIVAPLVSFDLPSEIVALIIGSVALIGVFACKDVAASLLGGLVLFLQAPFRVGYRVEIAGVEGRVTEMGLLSVRLLGPQQRAISVPNSEFLTKNVAASPPSGVLTLIQVDFYIRPHDDIAHAKHLINEVIQSTRGADASKGMGGIVVSQVPVNGVVMVRLRAKVFVTGTHPEQELASELSERVIERLRGGPAGRPDVTASASR